tara:strand:- start:234 stop:755 length:522 start_codon:yes stop_codon:yes gene_type:complete
MGFFEAGASFFKRAFDFTGRSSRSEYWYAQLFLFLVSFVIGFVETLLFLDVDKILDDPEYYSSFGIFTNLWIIILIIPGISLTFRRMHDISKSGFWVFLPFASIIPMILAIVFDSTGMIILTTLLYLGLYILVFVWFCQPGHNENKYGANPLMKADDDKALNMESPIQRIRRD